MSVKMQQLGGIIQKDPDVASTSYDQSESLIEHRADADRTEAVRGPQGERGAGHGEDQESTSNIEGLRWACRFVRTSRSVAVSSASQYQYTLQSGDTTELDKMGDHDAERHDRFAGYHGCDVRQAERRHQRDLEH